MSTQIHKILWEGLPPACGEDSVTTKREGMLRSSFPPYVTQSKHTGQDGALQLTQHPQEGKHKNLVCNYQLPPHAFSQILAMLINKQQKVIFAAAHRSFLAVAFFVFSASQWGDLIFLPILASRKKEASMTFATSPMSPLEPSHTTTQGSPYLRSQHAAALSQNSTLGCLLSLTASVPSQQDCCLCQFLPWFFRCAFNLWCCLVLGSRSRVVSPFSKKRGIEEGRAHLWVAWHRALSLCLCPWDCCAGTGRAQGRGQSCLLPQPPLQELQEWRHDIFYITNHTQETPDVAFSAALLLQSQQDSPTDIRDAFLAFFC